MLISTKGRYALRVLVDMAEHQDEGLVSLKNIADRQGISLKYMEIIASMLVKAEIITGFRGKTGGYTLARSPEDISLLEILNITEGTIAPVHCLDSCTADCPRKESCSTLSLWTELDDVIKEFCETKTIASIMKKGKENG